MHTKSPESYEVTLNKKVKSTKSVDVLGEGPMLLDTVISKLWKFIITNKCLKKTKSA